MVISSIFRWWLRFLPVPFLLFMWFLAAISWSVLPPFCRPLFVNKLGSLIPTLSALSIVFFLCVETSFTLHSPYSGWSWNTGFIVPWLEHSEHRHQWFPGCRPSLFVWAYHGIPQIGDEPRSLCKQVFNDHPEKPPFLSPLPSLTLPLSCGP